MSRPLNEVLMDYQKMIAEMDKKLAVYEQLGTPEEIAEKLKVALKPIPESVIGNVSVRNTNAILEAKRAQMIKEEQDSKFKSEVEEVLEKVPTTPSVVSVIEDINNLLKQS